MSPAGGLGLPPKTDVMRLMKVDLPHPVGYRKEDSAGIGIVAYVVDLRL